MKLNTRLNNRPHEISSVILILCSVNLLNCECLWPQKLSPELLFLFSESNFISMVQLNSNGILLQSLFTKSGFASSIFSTGFVECCLIHNLKSIIVICTKGKTPNTWKPNVWTATVIQFSSYTTVLEKKRRVLSMPRLPCYCLLLNVAGKFGTITS